MRSREVVVLAVLLAGAAAAGSAAAADLLFQAEAQTLSGACAGSAVRLEGNHNTLSLTGTCQSLLLKGVANTVRLTLARAGSIRVEGSANRVRYNAAASPRVEVLGPDNEVSAAERAQAPTPAAIAARSAAQPGVAGPLLLGGDDQERIADCAGQDATVIGNRSAYQVRGGCRSLTVRGNLLTVQAEMRPGARIAVTGSGSVVSWTLHGHGSPPAAVVRGPGSRVQRSEPEGQ